MKRIACLLALLGGLSFAAMGTELYKWVDENGVVHYSQMPPENTQPAEVEVQETYPDAQAPQADNVYAEVIEQQQARRELEQQKETSEKLEREAREEDETRDTQNCARAIHSLDTLQKQCPVFYDGAGFLRAACPRQGYIYYEGERTYIEDEERQKLITFYSDVVQRCKGQQR